MDFSSGPLVPRAPAEPPQDFRRRLSEHTAGRPRDFRRRTSAVDFPSAPRDGRSPTDGLRGTVSDARSPTEAVSDGRSPTNGLPRQRPHPLPLPRPPPGGSDPHSLTAPKCQDHNPLSSFRAGGEGCWGIRSGFFEGTPTSKNPFECALFEGGNYAQFFVCPFCALLEGGNYAQFFHSVSWPLVSFRSAERFRTAAARSGQG